MSFKDRESPAPATSHRTSLCPSIRGLANKTLKIIYWRVFLCSWMVAWVCACRVDKSTLLSPMIVKDPPDMTKSREFWKKSVGWYKLNMYLGNIVFWTHDSKGRRLWICHWFLGQLQPVLSIRDSSWACNTEANRKFRVPLDHAQRNQGVHLNGLWM